MLVTRMVAFPFHAGHVVAHVGECTAQHKLEVATLGGTLHVSIKKYLIRGLFQACNAMLCEGEDIGKAEAMFCAYGMDSCAGDVPYIGFNQCPPYVNALVLGRALVLGPILPGMLGREGRRSVRCTTINTGWHGGERM